jgi:hypothetical protein
MYIYGLALHAAWSSVLLVAIWDMTGCSWSHGVRFWFFFCPVSLSLQEVMIRPGEWMCMDGLGRWFGEREMTMVGILEWVLVGTVTSLERLHST